MCAKFHVWLYNCLTVRVREAWSDYEKYPTQKLPKMNSRLVVPAWNTQYSPTWPAAGFDVKWNTNWKIALDYLTF